MSPQRRIAVVSIAAAAVLIAAKLTAGLSTGSLGLVSEAAHSGSDLAAALLTFFALGVAIRPADRSHPWGHGKAEHLAALAEAAALIGISIFIAIEAISRLTADTHPKVDAAWFVFVLLAGVIAIDASRAIVSHRASKRYASPALAANAVHFTSDFVGSGAVLVGFLLVRAGTPAGDSIAALLVACLIVVAAARLIHRNVDALMDGVPATAESTARQAIDDLGGSVHLRRLRMREAGGHHFADVVIGIAPGTTVAHGHELADEVERAVEDVLPGADVVVHIEPETQGLPLPERVIGAALGVASVEGVHNVAVLDVDGGIEISLHIRLPGEMQLDVAHAVASSVEAAVREEVPNASIVHTHLEPRQPLTDGSKGMASRRADRLRAVDAAVERVTGVKPLASRIVTTDDGLVVFLTVTLGASTTLAAAHDRATTIESEVRNVLAGVSEVVVHTEP
jgi:cation diffusion facilitator family transporter